MKINIKQIKEKVMKHDILIVFIIIVLVNIGHIFYNGICTGDEYLLFNHTLKMYNRENDL